MLTVVECTESGDFQPLRLPNDDIQIEKIACTRYAVLIATKNQNLYMMHSRLLMADKCFKQMEPEIFCFPSIISHLEGGGSFANVVLNGRQIYSNGENYIGELGIGTRNNHEGEVFHKVDMSFLNKTEHISIMKCGYSHTVIYTNELNWYVCGNNENCQCMISKEDETQILSYVKVVPDVQFSGYVTDIQCGGAHTAIITSNRELYWSGASYVSSYIFPITHFTFDKPIQHFRSARIGYHSALILENGDVYLQGNHHYHKHRLFYNSQNEKLKFERDADIQIFRELKHRFKFLCFYQRTYIMTDDQRVFVSPPPEDAATNTQYEGFYELKPERRPQFEMDIVGTWTRTFFVYSK